MLSELKEVVEKLEGTKKSLDAVIQLIETRSFSTEDTIKCLKRISEDI